VKLCDFGISISRSFSSEITNDQYLGDDNYMPPSLITSIQDDMWALGVSSVEILSRANPFCNVKREEKPLIIAKWQPDPLVLNKVSLDLQELILHL